MDARARRSRRRVEASVSSEEERALTEFVLSTTQNAVAEFVRAVLSAMAGRVRVHAALDKICEHSDEPWGEFSATIKSMMDGVRYESSILQVSEHSARNFSTRETSGMCGV